MFDVHQKKEYMFDFMLKDCKSTFELKITIEFISGMNQDKNKLA